LSPASAANELYAYWRVASARRDEAVAAVQRLQAQWRARLPGLEARLLVREGPDAACGADGSPTWTLMEVYRHPAGIAPASQCALDAEAGALLQGLLAGPRRVEVFRGVPPTVPAQTPLPPGPPPPGR
jgi:hypothetical protein